MYKEYKKYLTFCNTIGYVWNVNSLTIDLINEYNEKGYLKIIKRFNHLHKINHFKKLGFKPAYFKNQLIGFIQN